MKLEKSLSPEQASFSEIQPLYKGSPLVFRRRKPSLLIAMTYLGELDIALVSVKLYILWDAY